MASVVVAGESAEVALRAATTGLSETETMVTTGIAVAGSMVVEGMAAVAATVEEATSRAPEQAQDPFLPHRPLPHR
ncbi:MAG: hypothetical protein M3514_14680 [Actinomycetota bacterium]|nr:hypothetical protein [Actinomycetota bacterium]